MEDHEKEMNEEVTRLMEEMERRSQLRRNLVPMIVQQRPEEQSITTWGAVLFAAIAGGLILLFWLWRWLRKTRSEPDSGGSEKEILDNNTDKKDKEEEEGSDREGVENKQAGNRITSGCIEWPGQIMMSRSRVVKELVDDLLRFLRTRLSNSFVPVLQPAIGVGSAFEGWSPCEADDAVYQLLVPLEPPAGHSFHRELATLGRIPARDYRIRVVLECACRVRNMLCFIHSPKHHVRMKNRPPYMLDFLCTHSYLDVEKLALWFRRLVKQAWVALPWARHYKMEVLPYSQRTCYLMLTSGSGRPLYVEVLLGVQVGCTDIFLTSHSANDTYIRSTIWQQSCAVAESKFFSHMTSQVPQGSFHLRCLHLCTRMLKDTEFSPYTLKTIVMHFLNTRPLSSWCRRGCFRQVVDILNFLHQSVEQKQLNHFFFSNSTMPEEIILPKCFEECEPYNILQHLVQNPDAHARALRQCEQLQEELLKGLPD
ncbi:inositol 1,4,5-trisphosphate receptor-interacting protein-like 1 [Dryobates pubescens]|uniref:inositol 1,4,5-trisphosphate receptor-interacting protein-like 1 n=1 Tax=Dryobates pubescens TaxID=118200 RepID=UPI0023B92E9C|nr:inositol 1,4,5-trisphosphate receptor-interacting protein-like 1 [Dryobates pubescens]